MATQEKLLKSLEALKSIIGDESKKKDKFQHCSFITEAISNPTIKIAHIFVNLLSASIELFVQLCDDPECDIRMHADECLNRMIRASKENVGKIQIELHKEIKKNGSARSLRAAFSRFAQLAHLIRPHKGKAYVANLIPSIIKISERDEDILQETLASNLPKVMEALGSFTSDNDIKILLKGFLNNKLTTCTVKRRTTASCILSVCINSRKPFVFITYVLNIIIDYLVPLQENQHTDLILFVFGCLKAIIPHIKGSDKQTLNMNYNVAIDRLIQVYELCLHYSTSNDYNVMCASLETLNVLLTNCTVELENVLLCPNGITESRINFNKETPKVHQRSPSQTSVATTHLSGIENLDIESDLTDTLKSDIERWIDDSKLSVININDDDSVDKPLPHSISKMTASSFENIENSNYSDVRMVTPLEFNDRIAELDNLTLSDRSSDKNAPILEEDCFNYLCEDVIFFDVNIGDFSDKDIPLNYCVRLIAKSFLLTGEPGKLVPDKIIRVSIKSLALNCLSSILSKYPQGLLLYLNKDNGKEVKNENKQQISDILLYEKNADPQLRGTTRLIVANYLKAVLLRTEKSYSYWLEKNASITNNLQILNMNNLLTCIKTGLEDTSSICTRQSLISLSNCLKYIVNSDDCLSAVQILNFLPTLAKNPYWLVKVKLIEIVAEIEYITIQYVLNASSFQKVCLNSILMELLKDDDQRVRNSASNAICRIIPFLFFNTEVSNEFLITQRAIQHRNQYLSNLTTVNLDSNPIKKKFISNMPYPLDQIGNKPKKGEEECLSRFLAILQQNLLTTTSKPQMLGILETLSLMTVKYPPTVYSLAWGCYQNFNSCSCCKNLNEVNEKHEAISTSQDLLSTCISMLTQNIICYDFNLHLNLLKLTGNLYSGKCIQNLKLTPKLNLEEPKVLWSMLNDKTMPDISEQFLVHIVKMLNIFSHVLEDLVPVLPQAKTVLPTLPTPSTLSPIKRRKSDLGDKIKSSPGKPIEKEEKEKKGDANILGYFVNSPYYMKLYELIRTAYNNYKITLDDTASANFLGLLNVTLTTLSQILEIGTITEFGRVAEEVLGYLRSTFHLEAPATVECVRQLLKSLFGSNLSSNISEVSTVNSTKQNQENEDLFGFYYNIFQKPYNDISSCIRDLSTINKVDFDSDNLVMGYLHRREAKKTTLPKGSDKILASYIRIFEPMVIKSLKQYTITSDVKLQCRVLQLLSQLVQLHVNYCLLDSEQIFIGFVLKQFEFIEEGQIQLSEELIPKIFKFLVHLSYGKQHSKSIIGVPKILQLCDGLMASGQYPITHCIPALRPVVVDIFLKRNKSNTMEFKELETTREVLLSMLLKLIEYSEVIELLALILYESKYCDKGDKWMKWSKQVMDVLLPSLKQNKIQLEDANSFNSLKKLIFVLNPNIFDSPNELVKALFQDTCKVDEDSLVYFNRWLGKQIILLLILLQLKEEIVLQKITELQTDFHPNSIFYNINMIPDPLNATAIVNLFHGIEPEVILVRLLLKTINTVSQKSLASFKIEEDSFLVEQLSTFMMCCVYIFQSGTFSKSTKAATDLINNKEKLKKNEINLIVINSNFVKFANCYPLLTFQWSYMLFLLNYSNCSFWKSVLCMEENKMTLKPNKYSFNMEVTKLGCCILYCDYLSENTNSIEDYSWLLTNYIDFIVNISDEVPVFEFINSVHRKPESSKIFIEVLQSKSFTACSPIFKMKILSCIENVHSSQVGLLLEFLTSKLLNSKEMAVMRLAVKLATTKIEYLFTLNSSELHNKLQPELLMKIVSNFKSISAVNSCETLISLLNKLCVQHYNLTPIENIRQKSLESKSLKDLVIDKSWYLSQVKSKCKTSNLKGEECAELLSKLEYEDLIEVMSSNDFNKIIVKHCFLWCLQKSKLTSLDEHALYKASVNVTLTDLRKINEVLPPSFWVNVIEGTEKSSMKSLANVFKEESYWEQLKNISSSTILFVNHLYSLPTSNMHLENLEDLLKFAVLCLESIYYQLSVHKSLINIILDLLMNCSKSIFKQNSLSNVLTVDSNILLPAIDSLYRIVICVLWDHDPLVPNAMGALESSVSNKKIDSVRFSCHRLSSLISWIERCEKSSSCVNNSLFECVKSIAISLARLPVMNSYNLTPPTVWKNGWEPELTGIFNTEVPPIPIEFIQEVDILEEFIYRISLLGWTHRQQFEETWMCLLSVLSPTPGDYSSSEDITHATSLAIQAITALLIETLSEPIPGNKNLSQLIHVPRDLQIIENSASIKKLKSIHNQFENIYLNITQSSGKHNLINVFNKPNLEKISNSYSYSQLSVEYLSISAKIVDIVDENCLAAKTYKKRQKMLEDFNLDVNSCIQFLLELYSQWIKSSHTTQLRILHEVVKSMLLISDLFNEKAQYSWMLESFMELYKNHTADDEVLHQYLVIGICKSVSLLLPQDMDTLENIKKILVQSLKSPFLPARIASLHGMLFILQGCLLTNTIIGGISEEIKLFLPIAIEYIQCNSQATNSLLSQSQEHNLLVWSLSFYIIENIDEAHMDSTFVTSVVQSAIFNASNMKSNLKCYNAIMKGLERLIIRKCLSDKLNSLILKFSLTNMKDSNQIIALPSIQLLLTCMYTECAGQLQNAEQSKGIVQSNPDNLVQTLEKVSAIFDKIKKGHITEVELLCAVLPTILNDFFPPSDILTKVIGEFLSPQQRHPKLLSKVVFQVFDCAIQQSQLSLLQDWVVFSLSNFIQLSPIGMATWCLTCFFISATTNKWLRSLFPFVQSRIGRYEYEDRKMLCISAADFYRNLTNSKQKETFIGTFEKVRSQPDTPYQDLLSSL